jgi:hypothetical protein
MGCVRNCHGGFQLRVAGSYVALWERVSCSPEPRLAIFKLVPDSNLRVPTVVRAFDSTFESLCLGDRPPGVYIHYHSSILVPLTLLLDRHNTSASYHDSISLDAGATVCCHIDRGSYYGLRLGPQLDFHLLLALWPGGPSTDLQGSKAVQHNNGMSKSHFHKSLVAHLQ